MHKKDGRYEDFQEHKLLQGIMASCQHTRISRDQARGIALQITAKIMERSSREISTQEIGEMVMHKLKELDDVCSTAETLCQAAKACKEAGALSIYAMVAHGVFASKAIEKIERSQIEKLIVSNSIAHPWVNHPKIEVVSVARIFGEAIHSIMNGSSILSLFGS